MQAEFEPRAPQLRCRDCGRSEGVTSVCHRCGDPVCRDHDVSVTDAAGALLSCEFADLDLDGVQIHHCKRCHHVVKGRLLKLVYGGGAAAVLGLVLSIMGLAGLGIPLLLAGIGVGVAGYFGDQARVQAMMAARMPLPLAPAVESAEVVERLTGTLVLDEKGRYHSEPSQVAGSVDLKLTFGRQDRERLERYRKKYAVGSEENVEFSAGFVMLRGQSGLVFDDEALSTSTVLPLTGSIADQPFFDTAEARAGAQWEQHFGYRLDAASKPDYLPLWLTPSLMPEQGRRTIELELQWIAFRAANEADLEIESLEQLRLDVPVSWGNVESVSSATADGGVRHYGVSSGADSADGEPRRTIVWNQCALSARERREKRLTVSIRFDKEIDASQVVRGRLQARFRGTLSGLTGVDVVHPLGGRREDIALRRGQTDSNVRTEVDAEFELSLRQIRYQAVRKVPDRKEAADAGRPEKTEFRGVIPDYETVAELTNAISDRCYVKRVLENPPRSSGKGNGVNRYWNIAGRRYNGVFPVDFQIILTGEENNPGGVRAGSGDTIVSLTVTGSYANESMFERIGTDWSELHEWISEALERTRVPVSSGSTRDRSDFDAEPLGVGADAGRGADFSDGVSTPPTVSPPSSPPRSSDGAGSQRRDQQLRELRDAVINGRITQPMYERLRAEIEQEFDGH